MPIMPPVSTAVAVVPVADPNPVQSVATIDRLEQFRFRPAPNPAQSAAFRTFQDQQFQQLQAFQERQFFISGGITKTVWVLGPPKKEQNMPKPRIEPASTRITV